MRKIVIGISAALLACTAFAQAPREVTPRTSDDVERVFEALDRNDDERISRKEAAQRPRLNKRFAGVDASGDGYLTRSEYRARPSSEPFE